MVNASRITYPHYRGTGRTTGTSVPRPAMPMLSRHCPHPIHVITVDIHEFRAKVVHIIPGPDGQRPRMVQNWTVGGLAVDNPRAQPPTSRQPATGRDQELWEPTIHDVLLAQRRLAPHLVPTPLLKPAALVRALGCEAYIKCESLQPLGAFKVRGGVNLRAALVEQGRPGPAGPATASRGNLNERLPRVRGACGQLRGQGIREKRLAHGRPASPVAAAGC